MLAHPRCSESLLFHRFLETIDAFLEKLLHSAEPSFPAFGSRLLTLQHYMIAQSPNSIKALWYDRRDIHRFWNFWAVIILGGLSLILSIIQTVLGGIQVHLTRQDARS
ncbi:hypothetical protein B0H67DRAFT_480498 [Lasiosphaeris hirsuta]|uniref:Uncharacterized protein n=1 Tax=Lasiosphaeris hirsuta TaxID=260670 RepID=A0AA40B1P1_9PEZI|nr:hypothetical protein B0H67DRAFT_480498 [Lasiosphaeris hirsuta]